MGQISTLRGVERQISNALKPAKNPKLQDAKYLKNLQNLLLKEPRKSHWVAKKENRVQEVIRRADELLIHKKVEWVNHNKPFSTAYFDLNTKTAFPDMPDFSDKNWHKITKDFEIGEPHPDVYVNRVASLARGKIVKVVKEELDRRGSMKIQVGVKLQF